MKNGITQTELIEYYVRQVEKRTGKKVSKVDASNQLHAFGETILGLALTGKNVGVTGFGVFRVVNLAGRKYHGGLATCEGKTDVLPRKALRFTASHKNRNL